MQHWAWIPQKNKFVAISDADRATHKSITVEEYNKSCPNKGTYNCIIFIENVKFNGKRPIIYTLDKIYAIMRYKSSLCDVYVHPSCITCEFMSWYANTYPMDILSLPLAEIDFELAKSSLISVLKRFEFGNRGYSKSWFSNVFRDMPEKFKDKLMCMWAYKIDENLVRYFPLEHATYDMYNNLSNDTYVSLSDVPMVYRDLKLCLKFIMPSSSYSRAANLGSFPKELRTRDVCDKCFEGNPGTIIYIPQEFITYEMALKFAQYIGPIKCSDAIKVIPPEYQTIEFWKNAVATQWYNNKNILGYVPPDIRDNLFIAAADAINPHIWLRGSLGRFIKKYENKWGKPWQDLHNVDWDKETIL